MNKTFAIVAIVGVAMAAPEKASHERNLKASAEKDVEFLQFAAKYNKDVRRPDVMARKQRRFRINDGIIKAQNHKADMSGDPNALRLGHNLTSDMEPEEYEKLLGLDRAEAQRKKVSLPWRAGIEQGNGNGNGRGNGRHLQSTHATGVDHVKDGNMFKVKDQGGCGSCWAFAANTALEGTVAKKTGKDPVHYSEQHLVDCSLRGSGSFAKEYLNYGCGGGWMSWAWEMQEEEGVMLEDDYPYFSGSTGTEGACKHDSTKIVGKVTKWGQVTQDVETIKTVVARQPVTVALDAGRAAFQLYRSGVVRETDNCGSSASLNHAVVIVGYTDSGEYNPNPNPGPDPDTVTECTVTKWFHNCPVDDRRRLRDANGDDHYWLVQNSWGTEYGDDGFIRIGMSEGDGVCGINAVVQFVDME